MSQSNPSQPDLAHIDVRYVADLARIALTEDESERFQAELDDILEYVAKVDELELDGIQPTAHAAPRLNLMREDQIDTSLPRTDFIANTPADIDERYVRVPPVIDEGAP